MKEFEILARGLYRPEQVQIDYDPTLSLSIDPVTQAEMDRQWEQKLAYARKHHFLLYDSNLFRLIGVEGRPDGTLRVVLGDTSYKEYAITREPAYAQGRSREELSNALAVCSVVETSDNYILYEKRRGVDVHPGRYHVIAGFFERGRDRDSGQRPDPFAAMYREIREETGIQREDIIEQYCLGSVYDLEHPHGELCFWTRLNISLAEVHRRTPEDDEIQHLLSMSATAETLRDFILENHGNISATGEPNLLMYGAVKFGEAWFEEIIGKL